MKQKDQLTIRMLRSLVLLMLTMLAPIGAWAQTDYGLTVAGVTVTSDNATNITGQNILAGTVKYEDGSHTLTLDHATINGSVVVTGGFDLVVCLVGDNTIQGTGETSLANGISRGGGSAAGKLTFDIDIAKNTSGSLFFPYVTTPIAGFANIEYLNGLEWGCRDEGTTTDYVEGVGTEVVLASIGASLYVTKTKTTMTLSNNGGTVTYRKDDTLGHVLTLSGLTDLNNCISWYSPDDVKIEISGTNNSMSFSSSDTYNSVCFEGKPQSNISFIFTGSTATLKMYDRSQYKSLGHPWISGFRNASNPTLSDGLKMVEIDEYRYDNNQSLETYVERYITTETYGLNVRGIQVHHLDGVLVGHKDNILGLVYNEQSAKWELSTSVTFNSDDNILTLNNANINYNDGNAIVSSITSPLTVHLTGENSISSGSYLPFEGAIGDDANLVFTTNTTGTPGSLTMTSTHTDFGPTSFFDGFKQILYPEEQGSLSAKSVDGNVVISQETGYGLKVAGIVVTEDNASHILGENNTTVTFTPATEATGTEPAKPATLTLTDAAIGSATAGADIQVLVDDLTIEISGTNTIYGTITYSGSNYQSSNIQINKASSAESASLTATNVSGFSSCTWGDGLYLSAHDGQGATVDVHYEHFEGEGGAMQSYYGEITDVTFSTEETNAIWVAGHVPDSEGVIEGDGITGTVTYNDGVLTLNGATIFTNEDNPSPLIVCNGDLMVELVGSDNTVCFNGDYSTYVLKNNGATGTLTFTGEGELNITTDYGEGTYIGLCDGFSTVDFGDLTYTVNGDTKYITPLDISTPMMNVYEGKIEFITNGYLFGSTTYYKIVYADDPENEEEVPLTNSDWSNYNEKITISELTGPCTVYAYTKYKNETGNSAKAKLFGPAEEIQRIVYGETASLAIAPAIEDGDGIKISGIEANNLSYDSETGEVTGTTIGSTSFPVPLSYTSESGNYMPGNTIILNSENFYMDVDIVPPAPAISLEAGTYLSTHDPITITGTGQANTTIKYKWDDGAATVYDEAIPVQSGTLKAWEEYTEGNTTVTSDITTVTYTVNTDIASLYVAPVEDVPYTGSAVTPTIVVKATEDAEASLVAGTDYTVSYKQGETAVAATVLINVATYTAVITGQGSYGGTKEVTFNIIKATPTITFAQESYSATLGETFTSPATVDDWTVTPTASSNMSVATISEGQITLVGVGTTTITVTYAGDDNYNSTSASYQLVVSRALDIAFVGSNLWATYYATEDLTVPEGLTAYAVSGVNETTGVVSVEAIGYILANKAILLQREANGAANGYTATAYTTAYTDQTTVITSILQGTSQAASIEDILEGYVLGATVYVLYNDAFVKATSGEIPANRGFLVFGEPAMAPKLTIEIGDGATGINDVRSKMAEVGSDFYDLSGRKLSGKPSKSGLYIKNGKKVVVNK